jgi:steroid delta-isomerase-like uncharacterized protein
MQMESNKAVAKDYAERIWDKRDLSAIEDLLNKDVIIHSLLGNYQGQESMRTVVQAWLTAFPDLTVKNNEMICEKDLVMLSWQAKGSHQGEFKGRKPSGKLISYAGVTLYRIKEGKISEYWAYLDMQHIFNQIS